MKYILCFSFLIFLFVGAAKAQSCPDITASCLFVVKYGEGKKVEFTKGLDFEKNFFALMDDKYLNTIKAVTVLKDEKATSAYGEKGKNGVVVITVESEELATEIDELLRVRKR